MCTSVKTETKYETEDIIDIDLLWEPDIFFNLRTFSNFREYR